MDGNVLWIIGTNVVAVTFGCGVVYQKLITVCKAFSDHAKNHPPCSFHTQVESDIAVLKSKTP